MKEFLFCVFNVLLWQSLTLGAQSPCQGNIQKDSMSKTFAIRSGHEIEKATRVPQGIRGTSSSSQEGLTGPTGSRGAIGPRGLWGIDGATGPEGMAGPTGLPGDAGPKGERGETGPKGERGCRGATGFRGYTGATGNQGEIGFIGPQGNKGCTGPSGQIGPKGNEGATGPTGPQGETGAPGPIVTFTTDSFVFRFQTSTYSQGFVGQWGVYIIRPDGSRVDGPLWYINAPSGTYELIVPGPVQLGPHEIVFYNKNVVDLNHSYNDFCPVYSISGSFLFYDPVGNASTQFQTPMTIHLSSSQSTNLFEVLLYATRCARLAGGQSEVVLNLSFDPGSTCTFTYTPRISTLINIPIVRPGGYDIDPVKDANNPTDGREPPPRIQK